ncbi:2Fe-2S iron-sulfur cluster binding domain-containing protein [Candidatus Nanopelagicus limnes]|jgi:aerobic-type carbon monoxide dehydrogenase small subunit (CoxS/CutS family)|uniref:2Fe-2S iron-sulfur cluster binding domain-containing protein n=1 Tax=Candidatus Nanopelagicus limnae TaxID=1884634 RepID=A0A249JYE8_9ACTN|nr:(2Fe-2S)-binding protein [Candidatus Nanopelagicus limnes]ASY09540.1 2Fe-2S iron-sulfur cluster binding domain-containing protein [Candidatus Nanopelagicus limnes]
MSQFNIEFTFDGESINAITGQSVAAALLAANQRALRKTRFNNNDRGVFCGIGVCFDCLVVIDGITNQRACLIEAKPGMKVQTQVGSDA